MPDPVTKLTVVGNATDAERAIISLQKKFDGLEQGIKRLRRESKQAGDDNPFKNFADGLGKSVAAAMSLQTIINLIKSEYADLIQRQEAALNTQKTRAGAIEALKLASVGSKDYSLDDLVKKSEDISEKTGVSFTKVAASMADAFSSLGQLPEKAGIEAVESAMQLIPNSPSGHEDVAGSTLDIQKVRPDVTAKQAQGLMVAIMKEARINTIKDTAEYAIPGLIGMSTSDEGRLEDNAAIISAITSRLTDKHGRKSRTAGIALANQMEEFFAETPGEDVKMSHLDMIRFFQQDDEARNAFLFGGKFKGKQRRGLQATVTGPNGEELEISSSRASFEMHAKPAIKELLTGGTALAQNLETARAGIPDLNKADGLFQEVVDDLQKQAANRIAQRDNRFAATAESSRAADVFGAGWASSRGAVLANLGANGGDWADQTIAWGRMMLDMGTGRHPLESANQQYSELASTYRGTALPFSSKEQLQERERMAERLDKLIEINQQMLDEERKRPRQPNPNANREQ